jgi:hypothetical protein
VDSEGDRTLILEGRRDLEAAQGGVLRRHLLQLAALHGVPDEEWYQVFGSDLDSLITECGPRIWLCGHVHITYDVTIGSTLVSSNPRAGDGPQIINPDFRESYVVEL